MNKTEHDQILQQVDLLGKEGWLQLWAKTEVEVIALDNEMQWWRKDLAAWTQKDAWRNMKISFQKMAREFRRSSYATTRFLSSWRGRVENPLGRSTL